MILGLMQPYFLPYIGYWQLLTAVDTFVLYDNIQYTKRGWINRNRFLQNGRAALFTLPLKHDSTLLDVADRSIADDFDRSHLLNRLEASYRRAPFFNAVFPLLASIIHTPDSNLFNYIHHSIRVIAAFLEIKTPIIVSSSVAIDPSIRGQNKVIAFCQALGAQTYINAVGGQGLYSSAHFGSLGVTLRFLKTRPIRYQQYTHEFVDNLSVLDVMMFNSRDSVRNLLYEYDLCD
jgi:hypothetical protein